MIRMYSGRYNRKYVQHWFWTLQPHTCSSFNCRIFYKMFCLLPRNYSNQLDQLANEASQTEKTCVNAKTFCWNLRRPDLFSDNRICRRIDPDSFVQEESSAAATTTWRWRHIRLVAFSSKLKFNFFKFKSLTLKSIKAYHLIDNYIRC